MSKLYSYSITIFIIVCTITISSFPQSSTATIKGNVYSAENNEPLPGANIIIDDGEYNVAADNKGYFEIENIPIGIHVLKCIFVGFPKVVDTINITGVESTVELDIVLKYLRIPIEVPDTMKNYHKIFENLLPEEILTLQIERISADFDTVFVKFTNITNYPVYLIEDSNCFSTISPIVTNQDGERMNYNLINLGCDVIGANYLPGIESLHKLLPNHSITFTAYESIKNYLPKESSGKCKYNISIEYGIKDYKFLPGVYSNPKLDYNRIYNNEIEVLNRALKGTYKTTNEFVIEY